MPSSQNSQARLQEAIAKEGELFEQAYLWLEKYMPSSFFSEMDYEHILMITNSLTKLGLQDFFSSIHIKDKAFALCLDQPHSDRHEILKLYRLHGIKYYKTYTAQASPDFIGASTPLIVCVAHFIDKEAQRSKITYSTSEQDKWVKQLQDRNPGLHADECKQILSQLNPQFLKQLNDSQVSIALEMCLRAQTRDECQYDLQTGLQEKDPSAVKIILAWRDPPQNDFLYQIAQTARRHDLTVQQIHTTYINPNNQQNILVMSLDLQGHLKENTASMIHDFVGELVTLKYFRGMELIESTFIQTNRLSGNLGNLTKSMAYFIHQVLVHMESSVYTLAQIEEDLCRHPELTVKIIDAFESKFHPGKSNPSNYETLRNNTLDLIENLDTGNQQNDIRRKHVFRQALHFIEYTVKTNFYRKNKTAHCFRLDPHYLDHVPYDRKQKFPDLPYAIFFMKGSHFLGFHIRFKDLSRGGLRTVVPEKLEQMLSDRNNVFSECYGLALTQQKKNKDIPEGGAKGVIFLEPSTDLEIEKESFQYQLVEAGISTDTIHKEIESFQRQHKLESMYQAQRTYIESFMSLINCELDGTIRAKDIIDYYRKPEYIYLGPDENMHNQMIEWIAEYSKQHHYKPGGAFISSRPSAGINHKEYGVTSLGVNVYLEEILRYLGIDPNKDSFTIKMTGGPDGDVAGNQMANLYRFYPNTAKLIATTDVSGTIYDPAGLDLKTVYELFTQIKPIGSYPATRLSNGGFLLDRNTQIEDRSSTYKTLCARKINGVVIEDWLPPSDMNHLLRHNVHQAIVDIFIPGGGRPKTLNGSNISDFMDPLGKPTAKAIVEGANLYLTPEARRALEELGVLIIKDSSANKGGVTCSSFEVLCSLCLSEQEFLHEKPVLVPQILEIIKTQASDEAQLLLTTHKETGLFLTDISDAISEKINTFMYELLDFLQPMTLSNDPTDPLIEALLNYCPPLLRNKYPSRIIKEIPDIHKKAIIASHLASRLVYQRGLQWSPHVRDVLPLICQDKNITGPTIT